MGFVEVSSVTSSQHVRPQQAKSGRDGVTYTISVRAMKCQACIRAADSAGEGNTGACLEIRGYEMLKIEITSSSNANAAMAAFG